jgi:hypothetical protein
MDLDTRVKLSVYETIVATTRPPHAGQVAAALSVAEPDVVAAFARLREKKLLVPEPLDPGRIRMAPPFSGIPTPFEVRVGARAYWANCVWDALGVAAALHADAAIAAVDGHTGEPLALQVRGGQPVARPCVVHFAVPAAHWWDDIVYT